MLDQGRRQQIEFHQLEIDKQNFRHEKVPTREAAIRHLVENERVIDLAGDIAAAGGLNPLESLGVVPLRSVNGIQYYTTVEGNRRVCALMLLHDPEILPSNVNARPAKLRTLKRYSEQANLPERLDVCVFKSKNAAKGWIDRLHLPEGDIASRKRWTADQRARAAGGGRYKHALAMKDAVVSAGLATQEEWNRRLSTVQRYLSTPAVRDALGLTKDGEGFVVRHTDEDFQAVLTMFLADLRRSPDQGGLSSRSSAGERARYAARLLHEAGIGEARSEPRPLASVLQAPSRTETSDSTDEEESVGSSVRARNRSKIGENAELMRLLNELGNDKLISLHRSIVNLSLMNHTPLATAGLWSFLSTLACVKAGRDVRMLDSFTPDTITRAGFSSKDQKRDIRNAIEQINLNGNATKHSAVATLFDGKQLANHFDVITPFVIALIRDLLPDDDSADVTDQDQ